MREGGPRAGQLGLEPAHAVFVAPLHRHRLSDRARGLERDARAPLAPAPRRRACAQRRARARGRRGPLGDPAASRSSPVISSPTWRQSVDVVVEPLAPRAPAPSASSTPRDRARSLDGLGRARRAAARRARGARADLARAPPRRATAGRAARPSLQGGSRAASTIAVDQLRRPARASASSPHSSSSSNAAPRLESSAASLSSSASTAVGRDCAEVGLAERARRSRARARTRAAPRSGPRAAARVGSSANERVVEDAQHAAPRGRRSRRSGSISSASPLQRHRHRVDGEVAAREVVGERRPASPRAALPGCG